MEIKWKLVSSVEYYPFVIANLFSTSIYSLKMQIL